jgi:hypothetical protein
MHRLIHHAIVAKIAITIGLAAASVIAAQHSGNSGFTTQPHRIITARPIVVVGAR